TGGSCKPTNLFAKHRFPLKWRATCVKNQGHRGTCVSFGITGAVEAAIAQKHNRWLNLSEERLYYWTKVPTAYGDPLSTAGTIGSMDSTAFTYPFEYQWDYNPSYSRTASGGVYSNSCVGYSGEHCSNTAHQGDLVCFDFLFWRFCAWDGSAPASSGFRLFSS